MKHLPCIRTRLLLLAASVLVAASAALSACDDGKTNDGGGKPAPPSLSVAPEMLELGSSAGAETALKISTRAAWTATADGEGFVLDKISGTGDAEIAVAASADNPEVTARELGRIVVVLAGTGTLPEPAEIPVRQLGRTAPEPEPEKRTITVDFGLGPEISVPALPVYSKTGEPVSGRREYVIEGCGFAVYADPEQNGKFGWIDNSQFSSALPEPTKGLYYSKLGAYIELPALEGFRLSQIVYTPTSSENEVELEIMDTDDRTVDHSMEYGENGTDRIFTMIGPAANTSYRIEVLKKNAQVARLELTYEAE